MKKICLSNLQYLLLALFIAAVTGCGASHVGGLAGSGTPGSVAPKLVWAESKTAAKRAALAPTDVTSIQVTVTGSDALGKAIPVVRSSFTGKDPGEVDGIYPGTVTVAVKALVGSTVSYEGFAIATPVASNASSNVTIVMTPPLEKVQDKGCVQCHETTIDTDGQNLVANFKQSAHYTNSGWTSFLKYTSTSKYGANKVTGTGCAACHGPSHNDPSPATSGRCYECHSAVLAPSHKGNASLIVATDCGNCHRPHNVEQFVAGRCIACHAVGQNSNATGNYVNDNNGVREITSEFRKWSHHVTGVTLNDAHCTACHLEGTVVDGEVVVDTSKHMADAKTHLRNADSDADMQWDPAAPSFSTLDNFCLACHDSDGATSPVSLSLQAYINTKGINAAGKTASPGNPFGDTISNQYDKLQRPAVVDAKGQFATGNPSHHAVLGQKYSGRTRSGVRQVTNPSAFASNSSATLPGARSTIYDAGKFQADYQTLGDAAGEPAGRTGGLYLGDDSTLHCADCHTVGQYRQADVGSRYNNAVIGAHGSNNEYLLRNNIGSDERHQGVETTYTATGAYASQGYGSKPYLVCFNCHAFQTYGSVGSGTSLNGLNHAGEYANTTRCNGSYNTGFGNMTGEARILSVDMRQVQSAQVGPPATSAVTAATYQKRTTTEYSNVFRIQCANCHNSGISAGNIFGGIHGSKDQTYTDGMGNTSKHVRFMPGLGNVMYVPGTKGGFQGGTLASYNSYSGNRNGTGAGNSVGQTFTTLPVRTIVPGVSPAASTLINGVTVPSQVLPYLNTLPTVGIKTGSYQYVTGGVSLDLNWEQISAQPIAGQYDFQAKAMGCYTLDNAGSPKSVTGYNGDAVKYAASKNIAAGANGPNGTTSMQDNWGGCDDHNNAQGAGTAPFRKVLRKTTY